jgi:hypothetical protein
LGCQLTWENNKFQCKARASGNSANRTIFASSTAYGHRPQAAYLIRSIGCKTSAVSEAVFLGLLIRNEIVNDFTTWQKFDQTIEPAEASNSNDEFMLMDHLSLVRWG